MNSWWHSSGRLLHRRTAAVITHRQSLFHPLVKAADRHGLLALEPKTAVAVNSVRQSEPAQAAPRTATQVEAPATTPPPTTSPPATTAPPAGETLPPGPSERPTGLVGGAFWDALTGAGVDPGVARCAADELLANTSEAELLSLGIASAPRPGAVNTLLGAAATRCGITRDQLDAAAAGGG